MRELNIEIPLKAVSQNNATKITRSGRGYKSAEAKEFKDFLFKYLMRDRSIAYFKHDFDPYKHYLELEFYFYFNHNILLTKKNKLGRKLSNRVGDVTNYIKWTEDCLMRYIGIDDRFVGNLSNVWKYPSLDKNCILVKVKKKYLRENKIYNEFLDLN